MLMIYNRISHTLMNFAIGHQVLSRIERIWITTLHWMVLIASGGLIVWITHDTLEGRIFLDNQNYRHFQLAMCILFQLDIITEWCLAEKKWKYFLRHILFILVSIPYLNIIGWAGVQLSSQALYLLCFVPMIRAGFVFAVITGALTASRALSTFYVYLIWVVASLFFASLMFYEGEHFINPDVDTFWTSLWWACMALSTAGCYVEPVTTTGNVLQFLLSVEGLVLVPVFTVYITKAVIGDQSTPADAASDNGETTPSPS